MLFELRKKPRLVYSNKEDAIEAAEWYFLHQIGTFYPVSVVICRYGFERSRMEYTIRFNYPFANSSHELYRVDSFDKINLRNTAMK